MLRKPHEAAWDPLGLLPLGKQGNNPPRTMLHTYGMYVWRGVCELEDSGDTWLLWEAGAVGKVGESNVSDLCHLWPNTESGISLAG